MKTLVINLKTYNEATGVNALRLAKICEKVSRKGKIDAIVCPQTADLSKLKKLKIKVFAQHIDPIEPGRNTGHVTAFSVRNFAKGTLINHSEKKLSLEETGQCVKIARENGLETLCFAKDIEETAEIIKFNPDYIAYEPPELVGGTVSVSDAKPEILEKFVKLVKSSGNEIKALCGAGINKPDDVRKAVELGADGIALSSAFVKAADPKSFLKDLVKPMTV